MGGGGRGWAGGEERRQKQKHNRQARKLTRRAHIASPEPALVSECRDGR